MSRNAKQHIRAAKGTVSLGQRLESMPVSLGKRLGIMPVSLGKRLEIMLVDISGTAVSCSLNYEVSIL